MKYFVVVLLLIFCIGCDTLESEAKELANRGAMITVTSPKLWNTKITKKALVLRGAKAALFSNRYESMPRTTNDKLAIRGSNTITNEEFLIRQTEITLFFRLFGSGPQVTDERFEKYWVEKRIIYGTIDRNRVPVQQKVSNGCWLYRYLFD